MSLAKEVNEKLDAILRHNQERKAVELDFQDPNFTLNKVDSKEKVTKEMVLNKADEIYADIIDDYSIDESIGVVEKYSLNDSRIRLLRTEYNVGPGIARNIGIENASGKYIAFLDSDDAWDKDKIKIQVNFMRTNNIAFSFTLVILIDFG